MAIKRQLNALGQMRVDVPGLSGIESAVAGDFQDLGTLLTGDRPLICWGCELLDTGMVGTLAANLFLRMGSAILLHSTATEAGAIYTVDAAEPDVLLNGTSANVVGSFTPGVAQTNYVSLDLIRTADPTTIAPCVFRSASTGNEFTQSVPLARVLNYKIYISTSDFSSTPTRAPIAKVVVGASGNIISIEDARQMYWRLGLGGVSPDIYAQYIWANRDEVLSTSLFTGGDKDIQSQYDFNRAVMHRLWELGGGQHWYSPADDRTVQLCYDDTSVFPSTGSNWYWDGTDLLWRGLFFVFANSTATENAVLDQLTASPGLTNLVDGEVLYVEVDRATNASIQPVKAQSSTLFALAPAVPGSRFILARRRGSRVYVNREPLRTDAGGVHATNTSYGTVKLFTAYVPDPANPIVPVLDASSFVVARGVTRDTDGAISFGTGVHDTSFAIGQTGVTSTILGGAATLTLKGNVADGGSAVANILDNAVALANATSKIASFRANNVEKAYVTGPGKGFFVGVDAGSQKVTSMAPPSADTDGANKIYVDGRGNAAGPVISSSSGTFTTSSTSYVDVTNLTVTIMATGRPMVVSLIPVAGSSGGSIYVTSTVSGPSAVGRIQITQDSVDIGGSVMQISSSGAISPVLQIPSGSIHTVIIPSAGSRVYTIRCCVDSSDYRVGVDDCRLVAYEI